MPQLFLIFCILKKKKYVKLIFQKLIRIAKQTNKQTNKQTKNNSINDSKQRKKKKDGITLQ